MNFEDAIANWREKIKGGYASGKKPEDYDMAQLKKGFEVEKEHTVDPMKAIEIAMDHLEEIPDYYDWLDDMETRAKERLKSLPKEEEKEQIYDYNSVQVAVPVDYEKFSGLQNRIPKESLSEMEENSLPEPHVTLLYGLTNIGDLHKVRDLFGKLARPKFSLGKISRFENEDFDVLKVDIESEDFHHLNGLLRKFDHENKYPEYKPHMTIAYLKKGACKDMDGEHEMLGETYEVESAEWSSVYGEMHDIPFSKERGESVEWHKCHWLFEEFLGNKVS